MACIYQIIFHWTIGHVATIHGIRTAEDRAVGEWVLGVTLSCNGSRRVLAPMYSILYSLV
jgi:hypothetical protein